MSALHVSSSDSPRERLYSRRDACEAELTRRFRRHDRGDAA